MEGVQHELSDIELTLPHRMRPFDTEVHRVTYVRRCVGTDEVGGAAVGEKHVPCLPETAGYPQRKGLLGVHPLTKASPGTKLLQAAITQELGQDKVTASEVAELTRHLGVDVAEKDPHQHVEVEQALARLQPLETVDVPGLRLGTLIRNAPRSEAGEAKSHLVGVTPPKTRS